MIFLIAKYIVNIFIKVKKIKLMFLVNIINISRYKIFKTSLNIKDNKLTEFI